MADKPSRNLKSIFHDPDYYAKSFKAYSNLSSRLNVLQSWIENIFPKKVVDDLTTGAIGSSDVKLRMLGIGSGTGEADCNMITQLLPRFPNISNTVLEPAAEHIESYKRLVASRGFNDVEWDWRQQTLEDYSHVWKTETGNNKFHFISTIHSLYYVDDVEKAVLNMYEMLEIGGAMLIIVLADDSGFGRLWRHFPMFSDEYQTHVLSDTVKDILTPKGIKYELDKQPSRMDVSCCFEEGNPDGPLVSDFLAHVINLRENAPSDVVKEFYEYLKGPECSIQEGGKVLFNNSWDAILVRK